MEQSLDNDSHCRRTYEASSDNYSLKQWVTLSFRNTIVLHQSVTPNNLFNT